MITSPWHWPGLAEPNGTAELTRLPVGPPIGFDVGLARLREAVTAGEPDAVCARTMARLIGTRSAQDDVALLVLRREDPPATQQQNVARH